MCADSAAHGPGRREAEQPAPAPRHLASWPVDLTPGPGGACIDHTARTAARGQDTSRLPERGKEPGVAAGPDELLTIEEVLTELRVPRSTFYRWRQNGTAPPVMKLPSGAVRIRRTALAAMAARPGRRPEGARRMTSYHVKFWDIKKISDTARGRYRVRWAVDGREHCKSFPAKPWRTRSWPPSKNAARDGTPFDPATGLPAPPRTARGGDVTWYEHARAYSQMKWPDLAAKSRRSTAEALTTITLALTGRAATFPDPAVLRRALLSYAFNAAPARQPAPRRSPAHWTGSRRRPCRWRRWKTRTPSAPS